jgi:hypothetical protein
MDRIIQPPPNIVKQGGVRRGRSRLQGLESPEKVRPGIESAGIWHRRQFRRDSCDPANR